MNDPDSMLKDPNNGKVPVNLPIPSGSLASIAYANNGIELLAAEIDRGAATLDTPDSDPVSRNILNARTQLPAGVAASADMFAAGDVVYCAKHKEEATVREIGSDGRVRVKWPGGEKSWVRASSIVLVRRKSRH